MNVIIRRILFKLLSLVDKNKHKYTKVYSVCKELVNHIYDIDIFQYANLESSNVYKFRQKLINGQYRLAKFLCPICNSDNFTLIARSKEGFEWGVCKKCGLLQNFNRLRPEDINSFYESGEYQAICMGDLDNETHFSLEYKVMSKYFIEVFNGLSLMPSEIRIMEIGCGSGGILYALKEWGVSLVKGYDIDLHRIEYGKNFVEELEVADALAINSINYDDYNYILLSNILEHLSDPLIFLKKLSKQLSTDEVKIIIDIPNLETCYAYSNKFNKFLHIGHIWYFNSITIERLLNDAMLKIENVIPRESAFTIICSKSKNFVTNTNNSYWNSISSINYANYMNTQRQNKEI